MNWNISYFDEVQKYGWLHVIITICFIRWDNFAPLLRMPITVNEGGQDE